MEKQFLDISWEFNPLSMLSSGVEVLNHYTNSQLGEVYITRKAETKLEDFSEQKNIFLSAIFETKDTDRKLLICLEDEKDEITNPQLIQITIEEIFNKFPKNIIEKQERILLSFYRRNPRIGGEIELNSFHPFIFYADDIAEVGYLLELMDRKNLIHCKIGENLNRDIFLESPIRIEEDGWDFIENHLKTENSKKVFIAMWFDEKMNTAAQKIKDVVEDKDFGFEAIRIDKKEHNNEISGEILYEIRQCKFMIADVTGQRPGVYFEAGYAMGQGIPVIWCCKEDELKNVHFDTRQYSHVVWKDEEDLAIKLSNRIKGTIL